MRINRFRISSRSLISCKLLSRLKVLILPLILMGIILSASALISISEVSLDTEQKLKSYADVNFKGAVKSDMKILKIDKFDDYVIIYFEADGKEQRWFKPIKSYNSLIK